jgi:hypothetical protein
MLSRKKSRHDRKIFLKKNKKNLALIRFLGYSLPAMIDSFIHTPEEYEEYCTAMTELATLAETETPDPEPENEEFWEDAMVYERLREESDEGYYRDDMGEDRYLDAYWEDRFEIDMGDY